jgi:hypothetical protein
VRSVAMLSRGRLAMLWLATAALLFGSGGSAWRDLVSSPAGTVVHLAEKGSDLVPLLKTLALIAFLLAIISLFANRLVTQIFSAVTGIFAILTLAYAFQKLGAGSNQAGVSAHMFWLPQVVGIIGIFGALLLVLITPSSAKSWAVARYRSAEANFGEKSLDVWRAQDAGGDPTTDV